ncbi:hypothetical protein [Nocardia vermiculata]|nr:hypothetical protein [Nocardia vermiculata]
MDAMATVADNKAAVAPARGGLDPLELLAAGRIALAVASLTVPRHFAKALGVAPSPELTYMTRIYGGRALAMGVGYLTGGAAERRKWRQLSLFVDSSDTLAGAVRVARRDLPLRAGLAMTILTGSYAAVGAYRIARER